MPKQKSVPVALAFCALLYAAAIGAGDLIDPTRPATRQKDTATAFVGSDVRRWILESTLVAPDRRVAVINGKPVSEGELVDGARILEIHKLNVLIKTSGKRVTLQLLPDNVKKQP